MLLGLAGWLYFSPPPAITTKTATADADATVKAAYGQLPLSFEANRGQTDGAVKFLARGRGYALFLTATEAVLRLQDARQPAPAPSSVLRTKLVGANPSAQARG